MSGDTPLQHSSDTLCWTLFRYTWGIGPFIDVGCLHVVVVAWGSSATLEETPTSSPEKDRSQGRRAAETISNWPPKLRFPQMSLYVAGMERIWKPSKEIKHIFACFVWSGCSPISHKCTTTSYMNPWSISFVRPWWMSRHDAHTSAVGWDLDFCSLTFYSATHKMIEGCTVTATVCLTVLHPFPPQHVIFEHYSIE